MGAQLAERLARMVDRLRLADPCTCDECRAEWAAAVEAAIAELAEHAQDARRYRWLRDRDPGPARYTPPGVFIGQVPENLILGGLEADQAVDAAMAEPPAASGSLQ